MTEDNVDKFVQPIALSWTYRNRLLDVRSAGVNSQHFNPDSIDIGKTFLDFMRKKQIIKDNEESFMRLINQPKFKKRQWEELADKLQLCIGLNCRFLVRFPEHFSDYNLLRNTFKEIQENAGMEKIYIFTGINETFSVIDNYLQTLNGDYVLVLDMAMDMRTFKPLLEKYVDICNEVVLLYNDWKKFRQTSNLAINTARIFPDKLHMAFVPIDMNIYGNKKIFSTVLIASGFKSVSLIDTKFIPFVKVKPNSKPKTVLEKLSVASWIDEMLMIYENIHSPTCSCCNNEAVEDLARRIGVKNLVTHHDLEVLSKIYVTAKTNIKIRNSLLKLDSVNSILTVLKGS